MYILKGGAECCRKGFSEISSKGHGTVPSGLSLGVGTGSAFWPGFHLAPAHFCPESFSMTLKGQTAAICHLCMSSFLFTRLRHVRHLRTGTVVPASLDATLPMTCAKVEFEILTERCMVTVDQQENHHSYHLLSTLWDRHFIYVQSEIISGRS